MNHFRKMIRTARWTAENKEPVLAGNSMAAHALRQMVALAGQSLQPVLVTGHDDSGHADVARAIHDQSTMSDQLFVDASEDLMDDDHFAIRWQGTLFLGDVARLAQNVQHALLDWFDSMDGQYVRIISSTSEADDVRRPLLPQLRARLTTVKIPYPPLAQRSEDIPLILQRLWPYGAHPLPPIFEASAWSAILSYEWPGNYGELQAFANNSARLYGGRPVTAENVQRLIGKEVARAMEQSHYSLYDHLAMEEKLFLIEALLRAGGVVQVAAESAGLKRATFVAKMKRHGLARS